ncbi:hypothetical protein RZ698_004881 [Citrobacter freundii]|nr:hypothetical protein [Citrobacter freundii]
MYTNIFSAKHDEINNKKMIKYAEKITLSDNTTVASVNVLVKTLTAKNIAHNIIRLILFLPTFSTLKINNKKNKDNIVESEKLPNRKT